MGEYLRRLFDSDLMPHGYCWKWEPWVVWTNVVSDVIIFTSYMVIGFTLIQVASRRRDMLSNPVLVLFGAFIVSCGCTHGMEVINTWNGYFRLAGMVKMITAAVSFMTVWPLMRLLPKIMAVPALTEVLEMDRALSTEVQEKRRMAGQLRETEDRFRLLVEGIKDYAIFLVDPEGRVTSWNPGAERLSGYTSDEALGRHISCFFRPEDVAADEPGRILREAAASGRLEEDGWRVHKDGTPFRVNGVTTAFYDGCGRVQGFAKVLRDTTAQAAYQAALETQAERLEDQVKARVQDLRESEARLQGFIRHAPAAIAFKGLDGRYLLINPRMEAALGRSSTEIIGHTDEELLAPAWAARARDRERQVLGQGRQVQAEEHWQREDGSALSYLVNAFPLVDATGRGWGLGVIATDITERQEADRALLQSQKLESLGVLAGGIAHDFNNLLGAMLGNVELAMTEVTLGAAQPHLETLKGLMARGADLLRQMLAYAGRGQFTVIPLDLNRLVGDIAHLLEASVSKKADLRLDLDPELPPLKGDPAQLQQVVMNLIINASEAMGEQAGEIRLRTRSEQVSQERIDAQFKDQPLRPGLHVLLEVADTGSGMTPEVQRKIFDPFFTTKFAGRGLGLAAIQGIVRGHAGGIQVQSGPGKGSSFTILFPASGEPAPADSFGPPPPSPPGRGGGTVLVVDDEAEMRGVVVKALERAGFATLQARDGREAVGLYCRHRDAVRLILMDLTMPVLDGEEACRELRGLGADVPVILTSGFNEAEAMARFGGLELTGFIQKPFDLANLVGQVLEVLK